MTLTSNRTAALTAFLVGLAGCGTALAQVWPSATMNEVALIAGGVGSLAGPLSHVVGSWLWDRTPAGQLQAAAVTQPVLATPDDTAVSLDEWRHARYPDAPVEPAPVVEPPAPPAPVAPAAVPPAPPTPPSQ